MSGPQHSINIAKDGFAWLGNGLLIRNGNGQDLVFDGTNPNSQSHTLDVHYFGTGGGPTSISGENVALGGFDIQNHAFGGTNQFQNDAGNVTTTFGGYWFQRGVYRDDAGVNEQVLEQLSRSGTNPVSLQHEASIANNGTFNRVNSAAPPVLRDDIRGLFSAPLRLIEAESQIAERRNALFAVAPAAPSDAGTLDLSGIDVTVKGTSITDRQLFGQIDLGRRMVGAPNETVSRSDDLQVTTFGGDDRTTRLRLGNFNETSGTEIQAVLNADTDFQSADATADVALTANFTIVGSQIGTFFEGLNVGSNISTLDSAAGQNVQSDLNIGYRYAVVDNNEAESESITVYKIDNFDTSGQAGRNFRVGRVHSKNTHTNIDVSTDFIFDGSAVQAVTLSDGSGISGEGLAGENVTATTTYNVHTKSVQSSELEVTPQGNVGESAIEIENTRTLSGGQLQATAFVVGASRQGNNRWYLEPDQGLDLAAGEKVTLTPTFDEVGLPSGELGRNYRTTFELEFQDGFEATQSDAVAGTFNSGPNGFSGGRFDVYGSDDTRQSFSWVVEKTVAMEAASGSVTLAAGTSLRDEGVNLTNTTDNGTDGFITTVTLLDGSIESEDETSVELSLTFEKLADASENEMGARGFEDLASDIVDVTGLDGNLHTLQMTYNVDFEETVGEASLLWFDEEDENVLDDGAWVNAVLGNSNIASYDLDADTIMFEGDGMSMALSEYLSAMQYRSSYTDYLFQTEAGAPELGAHGFDAENGVVWAVIDHNSRFSSFAAVPEPGSASLLGGCLVGLLLRRRRS
jgi:hypothetical protein